jgi:hypothetical protein
MEAYFRDSRNCWTLRLGLDDRVIAKVARDPRGNLIALG